MRKALAVLSAVIIAAMHCGCADDVSSVQQEDSSSRSSTKWTVTKVADDDISCEGLVLTALNSGDFPEMVKATDSTLLDTIMDFSKYGITDYCVYQQAISVELSEIIAVRADDTDGVKAALQSRKDSLIKQFGTYPEQEKIVSRTVVFQKGDLCFLIASEEPEKAGPEPERNEFDEAYKKDHHPALQRYAWRLPRRADRREAGGRRVAVVGLCQ